MASVALTAALFAYWLVLGLAVTAALRIRRSPLQTMLLAPTVGLATLILIVFTLNRVGLPVLSFATLSAPLLLIVAIALLGWFRPHLPWRRYASFPPVFALILATIAQPAIEYGFEWVGYANDDMANVVVYAQYLLHWGFYQPLDFDALMAGRDYTQITWFTGYGANDRMGAPDMTAWLGAGTGLPVEQVFMPLMLALHVVLASSAAAMVASPRRTVLVPLLTAGLVGFSALSTAATMNQLMGQVGGLSLLAGAATALLRPFERQRRDAIGQGVLIAILGAGQFIWYPETIPMLVVAFAIFLFVGWRRRRLRWRPMKVVLTVTTIAGLLILNTHLITGSRFMLSQAGGGTAFGGTYSEELRNLFSTYLTPGGLATLWGFQVIGGRPIDEPWQSATILLGAFLLAAATAAAVMLSWRRQSAAIITLVMLLLAVPLIVRQSGFGLYKLAMFIQPFVLGTLVIGWYELTRRRACRPGAMTRSTTPAMQRRGVLGLGGLGRAPVLRAVPPIFLGLAALQAQMAYVSLGRAFSTATHLPNGSATGILSEIRDVVANLPSGPVVSDAASPVLAKLQAVHTVGRPTSFPSRDVFYLRDRMCPYEEPDDPTEERVPEDKIVPALPVDLTASYCNVDNRADFQLLDDGSSADQGRFRINSVGEAPAGHGCTTLIATSGRQSIFNRRTADEYGSNFVVYPCGATNHLIFVDSLLSQHYYKLRFERSNIGIFMMEQEPQWRTGSFAGVGRYLLFRIDRPSDTMRLMLEMTASFKGDGENRLPPASAIGADRERFPMDGRGSARVFSPPLTPQIIGGIPYVAIDMGVDGQYPPEQRTGLMQWWGTDIRLDSRRLTGYARDISLVSEDEYRSLAAPSVVRSFPSDLFNPDLEYSGLYEDGAASESVLLGLTQPEDDSVLVVKGTVPATDDPDFATEMRVLVDGQEVARRMLGTGRFEVWEHTPSGAGRRRVELHFSDVQHLPGNDRRPVAALIQMVGFDGQAGEAPPQQIKALPADLEQPGLWSAGLDPDGWIADKSFFALAYPGEAADIVVRGEVLGLANPSFKTELRVVVDGLEAARKTIGVGDFELRSPVPPGPSRRRIELQFSDVQQLPAPDGRPVGALIRFIGFEAETARPPEGTYTFPADLATVGISASGLEGDGWLADTAVFDLAHGSASADLVLRGMVPLVNDPSFSTEIQVLVDGQEVARRVLGLGDFEIRAPAPDGPGQRRVELRFSRVQQLPAPDGREVGAQLRNAGFEARPGPSPLPRS